MQATHRQEDRIMAVINKQSKDIQRERQLRLIALGKLPVDGLRVKTPNGYVAVKRVIRMGYDTHQLVT